MQSFARYFIVALCCVCFGCQSDAPVTSSNGEIELFKLRESSYTGLDFTNSIKEDPDRSYYVFNQIYNGGGVSVGDINNDGLIDIFFTGNEVPNKLYLNKGKLKFEDITESAGLTENAGWHNGSSIIDINNDGYLDIYVCRGGVIENPDQRKNLLYINQGDNTFIESAEQYGLDDRGHSFQSSFFDYDNDGDLDVYVINHPVGRSLQIEEYKAGERQGSWMQKDHLYRNDGGRFTDVTFEAGIGLNYGYGLSLITADFTGDHYDDIYVCNDYTQKDYLWINDGNGKFSENILNSMKHISLFSMGSDYADIDNDGLEDLFVSEMLPDDYKRSKTSMADMSTERFEMIVDAGLHHQYMHNMMQLNKGDGMFSEISQLTGTSKTDWSWASFLCDFDNDGLRDLFVSNGYLRDVYDKDASQRRREYLSKTGGKIVDTDDFFELTPQTKVVNYIFQNKGDYKFEKKMSDWGFKKESFSNGASIADFDNDGDVDIVVNNLEDPAFLYENKSDHSSANYLRIKLNGPDNNRSGAGSKVKIYFGDQIKVYQHKLSRGYLSTVEDIVHFGLGDVNMIDRVEVRWFDGSYTIAEDIEAGQEIELSYTDAKEMEDENNSEKIFADVTDELFNEKFIHEENTYNDYKHQVLLPHRLSRLGPFVSVGDMNGDELDDFYVGAAVGREAALYLQTQEGGFERYYQDIFTEDRRLEDLESLLFDIDKDGDLDLYIVSGGTERRVNDKAYGDRIYFNDGKANFYKNEGIKTPFYTSGMSVSGSDYNRDGDYDLFVGGRTLPNYYPNIPYSYMLVNHENQMYDFTDKLCPELRTAGLVSSSVWADVNGDKNEDLLVVGEWMPIKVFINVNREKFIEQTVQYGLGDTEGWWNKIVAEDLDGDGDKDFIVGNLGENYKFKASKDQPFKVYSNDFDQNGTWDIVLAKNYNGSEVPVRGRQCTSEQMPYVAEKFPDYHAFANAELNEIVDLEMEKTLKLEAKMFSSVILWNEGNKFRIEPLPVKAQMSSINAIVVDDFDSDGRKEIVVAGNNFQSEVETTRADASFGLMLDWNSKGELIAVDYKDSGLYLPYEVRDMKKIVIAGESHYLVACNDDVLRCIKAK